MQSVWCEARRPGGHLDAGQGSDDLCTVRSVQIWAGGVYGVSGRQRLRCRGESEAHSAFFERRKGESEAAMQGKDLVTSERCAELSRQGV